MPGLNKAGGISHEKRKQIIAKLLKFCSIDWFYRMTPNQLTLF